MASGVERYTTGMMSTLLIACLSSESRVFAHSRLMPLLYLLLLVIRLRLRFKSWRSWRRRHPRDRRFAIILPGVETE